MDNLYSPFLVEHKNRYITCICDPQYICWSADAAAPLAIAVNFWSYVWNNSCSFCSLCVLWQHASHVNKFCAISEVITCAEFHPTHCNTLAYSSSKGSIRLIDLRQSALCDNHAKLLVTPLHFLMEHLSLFRRKCSMELKSCKCLKLSFIWLKSAQAVL